MIFAGLSQLLNWRWADPVEEDWAINYVVLDCTAEYCLFIL